MALEAITAVGNAISGVMGGITPYIDESVAQKHENEAKKRRVTWNDITANWNPDAVQPFMVKLCSDAGSTARGLGENVSVPMDFVDALVDIAIGKIKDDEDLANLQFKKA